MMLNPDKSVRVFLRDIKLTDGDGRVLAVAVVLAALFLVFDLILPLGVAAGMPYVVVVLIGLFGRTPGLSYFLAILCTVLVAVGYLVSPAGGEPWVVFMNRGLAILSVWAIAIMSARIHRHQKVVRDLFDRAAQNVFVYQGEQIVYASQTFADTFGYERSELVGMNPFDLLPPEYADQARAKRRKNEARHFDLLVRKKNGETFRVHSMAKNIEWRGAPARLVSTVDVSQQFGAVEALRQSRMRLEDAQRLAHLGTWDRDLVTEISVWSEETYAIFGVDPDTFTPSHKAFQRFVHPDDRQVVVDSIEKAGAENSAMDVKYRIVRPDGSVRHLIALGQIERDKSGRPLRICGVVQDVTDRKHYKDAASQGEARIRAIMDNAADGILTIDENGNIESFNLAAEKLFGYTANEVLGKNIGILMPEPYRSEHDDHLGRYVTTGKAHIIGVGPREVEGRHKDGTVMPVEIAVSEMHVGNRQLFIGLVRDFAERKRARDALRRSEQEYRNLIDASPQGILISRNGRIVYANQAKADMHGYCADELIGMSYEELLHDDELAVARENLRKPTVHYAEMRGLGRGGRDMWLTGVAMDIVWEGKPARLMASTDITEAKRADQAIRESESQLRLITDALPILIAYLDSDQVFRFANQTCADWHATTRENIIGRHAREILGPERYDKFRSPDVIADFANTRTFTETHAYPDGLTRDTEITSAPHFGQDGQLLGIFVLAIDTTAQKRAEARLRQAQKMEAVGQLTGGVAHDFNNLLAVILGNVELAKEQVSPESDVQNLLDKVFNAGQRGSSLVSRLLAFSRQQPLQTAVFSLNDLVRDMVELVERALGETFEVQIDLSHELELTKADVSQMENALLNLSLNARDAMGLGGVLGIRTENVCLGEEAVARYPFMVPGDYVMLSVSDNGSGMPKEIVDQVFEPFFTTKEVGKGTGLGLSTVYGFVKQSSGYVVIDSEVGQGTTVKIYLPSSSTKRSEALPPLTDDDRARGEGETILVVEDDVDVRELAVKALTSLGYRTLEADSAFAALRILRERLAEIDLLFSDIVLPGGKSGVELVDEVRGNGDTLKILLTTGYDQGTFSDPGGLDTGIDLLKKPYSVRQLATKVRAVLAA